MSETSTETTFATALYLLRRSGVDVANAELARLAKAVDSAKSAADAGKAAEHLAAALAQPGGFEAGLGRAFPGLQVQVVRGDKHAHASALRRARFGNPLPMLVGIADRYQGGVAIRWAIVLDVTEERVHILDPNPWDDVAEDHHLPLNDFIVRWELASSVLVTFRPGDRP